MKQWINHFNVSRWVGVTLLCLGTLPLSLWAQSADELLEMHFHRGRQLLFSGESMEHAIEDFSYVLSEDFLHFEARLFRAIAYFELGEIELAKADALYARHLHEADARLNGVLGIIAMREGRYPQASDFFTRQMQLDPNNPQAYINRAWALLMLPHYEELALADYQQALERDPDNVTALFSQLEPLLRLGRTDEAHTEITRIIHLYPELTELYAKRAQIRLLLGEEERALADYQQVLRLITESEFDLMLHAMRGIASIYLSQENWQATLVYSQAVLTLTNEEDAEALVLQGRALLGIYQTTGEADIFSEAQRLFLLAIERGFLNIVYLERLLHEANADYTVEFSLIEEVLE
ncbi:tetratricopeptide repeat protein [Entomospira culicis]|uniref:Tetratricopeptide repeat protein n=1 Tax=Entomospira culicis TaxID=2719989 RepID=A0A968KUW9_9SPIO|nr:tetratricopeptide repeat protein [Entomospira culicis]NIZ19780.1 tetratricopeptide repeat protein [Entomospira culicis]NIZ69994.1 tetratricopeptide repeat protein [Entomospira culicis]WDI37099.1 tetratricopeptide repeat protein [Entomospira culicis]WDI38728.1 tetratricopeptide repeat protein [Entomospira culicis]